MNRKKQKLIEIFLITFFFFIFIILFQLQSFVIVILLVASLTISLCFKNDIIEIILPKKKHFLYFIFFDIFLIMLMIKLFGDDFFLNYLDLKKYYSEQADKNLFENEKVIQDLELKFESIVNN